MNLRDYEQELYACAEAGNAVLAISGSGVGKSSKNRQVFEKVRERDKAAGLTWGYGRIFAATQTPPDLIGFQFKGSKTYPAMDGDGGERTVTVTDASVPLWFISDEGKPAFMYDRYWLDIEEYGQGEPDVKRAIAEIFLNGGTPPWYLPAGSVRVASSNEGTRYGVTKDFDFCVARRTRIDVVGDVNVWIEDFADKPYRYQGREWTVMPVTKAWAKQNPQIPVEDPPEKQGPWCNFRTLTAVDRYFQVKAGNKLGDGLNLDCPRIMEVSHGTIGAAATQSILGFFKFRLELPSYEKVVADPEGTEVPLKADMLLIMAYELSGQAKPEDMAALIKYTGRFPVADMQTTFMVSLLRRNYRDFVNLPATQAWINKNSAIISVINKLAA